MPVWWGKKSSAAKDHHQQQDPPNSNNKKSKSSRSSIQENNNNNTTRPKSLDEKILIRPTNHHHNKNCSNEFSGFNSVGGGGGGGDERRGHPLPRPVVVVDLGTSTAAAGLGSGSVSISSVSSSGSSDDNHHRQDHFLQVPPSRSNCEIKFSARSTSPGPGSKSPTTPTSPLHPRLSLESPTGRQEDGGKSPCHRLPLPPGSPTSPSSSTSFLPSPRKSGHIESAPGALSKWKKGKLLGRGTFGHVYLGFNSESGQMCAIKEVKVVSDDRSSKECLKQLNQEINLLSKLSHPNIVQYYGSELSEETLSVYLEYVSGGSIYKLLQEYGAFKEPVIQNYTRQIVFGLAYLHGRNTVHRDIKGANILVDPNGEIKLADFGMAKHISACTTMLSFKGSPYWMAPEVVMNTNGYTLAVDIWSLGCTILEMATSKPPWSEYEGVAAIFKIGNSRDIPNIPDYLSNEAKSFLRLCLQRDPSACPSSAQLLDHSFIRDQSTTRVANINIARDAFPHTFNGYRTPPSTLDIQSNRSIPTCQGDYVTKQGVLISRAARSPRDNFRVIASLPVSPCSSPLRQYGQSYKNRFPSSPPAYHPAYASAGQISYNISDYSIQPSKAISRYPVDQWDEGHLFKSPTPTGSQRP